MASVVNFGAGPAKLPREVLVEVQKELVEYGDTKVSVMEMSHRSADYKKINDESQQLVRQLLNVPDNYKVIFMQGGGTGLFAAVALNLISRTGSADYLVTGSWSAKAAKEAEKFGKVNLVLPKTDKYTDIPDVSTWKLDPNASYVYMCFNETIEGVQVPVVPDLKGVPLVADMSSDIMTRKIDVSKFGVIFAGAQKNIGPAGVTLVIVRDDLLGSQMSITPAVLDFTLNAKHESLYYTPPCFTVYVVREVFKWIVKNGGVERMEENSKIKSDLIYDIIDNSKGFFTCAVNKSVRSKMNVTFRIAGGKGDVNYDDLFLKGAQNQGFINLKGHRSVGGFRASLYNAVSIENVESLAAYMKEFLQKYT